jgi:hypothetical protein
MNQHIPLLYEALDTPLKGFNNLEARFSQQVDEDTFTCTELTKIERDVKSGIGWIPSQSYNTPRVRVVDFG